MAATIEVQCKWCDQTFIARVADRKRGWAKCCSKPCSASFREFGHSKAFHEARNPNGRRIPNIVRYAGRLLDRHSFSSDDVDDIDISDMDWGASDGGGYEQIR